MPADAPTILATSGGIKPGRRTRLAFSALTDYAVELSGTTGRPPRVCLLATAMGDDRATLHYLTEAAQERGFAASHLALFPMPNVDDITEHLLAQDVVWVFGGSVAGRPLFQSLVGDGTLPAGYATDDGAGVVYRGTEFVEAVAENDSAAAYFVTTTGNGVVETRLDVRRL
jgi:hypothetical protein